MRTTLNLDDELLEQARKSTGVKEKTRLLHLGLEALIQREGRRRAGGMSGKPAVRALLPVSRASGGLLKGRASLEEAVAAADLADGREQAR